MNFDSYKKYLFDLDDTLVDSSSVVFRSMSIWCNEHSLDLDRAIKLTKGLRTVDTIRLLAPSLDVNIEAIKIESIESKLSETIEPIAGAIEFLRKIEKNRWAVVTSSSTKLANIKLKAAGFPEPEFLISSDFVVNGKPDSEPYDKAVTKFGVKPKECLVFEDSESGIRSAVDAGCKVVIVGGFNFPLHEYVIGRANNYTNLQLLET